VAKDGILAEMARQTLQAIDEADAIIFLVDGRAGLTPQDKLIAERLRRAHCPVLLAVNKAEGMNRPWSPPSFTNWPWRTAGDFQRAWRRRCRSGGRGAGAVLAEEEKTDEFGIPKIALVGRPTSQVDAGQRAGGRGTRHRVRPAGTTRDSIYVEFERDGKPYILIDTAGLRRRGKVFETVEKFSVIKTLQAIEDANVVVLVLDARENISEQDAHLAGFVLETGRALVVAINKWDGLSAEQRDDIKRDIARKLAFLDFARFNYISALKAKGLETC